MGLEEGLAHTACLVNLPSPQGPSSSPESSRELYVLSLRFALVWPWRRATQKPSEMGKCGGGALTRGSHADGLRDESHAGPISHCNGTEIVRWNPFPQRVHTSFQPGRLAPTLSLAWSEEEMLRRCSGASGWKYPNPPVGCNGALIYFICAGGR